MLPAGVSLGVYENSGDLYAKDDATPQVWQNNSAIFAVSCHGDLFLSPHDGSGRVKGAKFSQVLANSGTRSLLQALKDEMI